MSQHRTAGLNQIGPPRRATNMSQDGYLTHKKPWELIKRKREAKSFAAWHAKHPEWQPSPELLARREERRKRRIVSRAIGDAYAQGKLNTNNKKRPITLPKLKCLEQAP